jgi:hypothetical protein
MKLTDTAYGQEISPIPRTFAYVRVSTVGQTTENQIQEIEAAGFTVSARRVISETVSGSSAIEQRPAFMRLLDRLEQDDVLIVTKPGHRLMGRAPRPESVTSDLNLGEDGTTPCRPLRSPGGHAFRLTLRPQAREYGE